MNAAENNMQRNNVREMAIAHHYASKLRCFISPNSPGRDKEKDFTLMVPVRCEIKTDEKAGETGNLFLEVKNSRLNERSGLMATKSELWVYFIPSRKLLIRFNPKAMLLWLSDKAPPFRYITGAGDANSDGYLVPIREILNLPFVSIEEGFSEPLNEFVNGVTK